MPQSAGELPQTTNIPRRAPTLSKVLLRDYKTHIDPLDTHDMTTMPETEKECTEVPVSPIGPSEVAQEAARPPTSSPQRALQSPKLFLSQSLRSPPTPVVSHRSMLRTLASRSSQESLKQDRSLHEAGTKPQASFAAKFLRSPCFFHRRFEDAVNVDRVLEEIAMDDDGLSHTRLMQTATSVREISKQLQRRPIKRAVRTVMIVTKARDNKLVYMTRELTEWLLSTPRYNDDVGVTVYVDTKLRTSKRFDAEGLNASNPRYGQMLSYWTPELCISSPEKFDLVLTLGGDGTVLYTSWLFQRIVPPILSFSLGSLGFLTNFAFNDYKPTLDRIMEGSGMRVNMRMRFTCTIYRAQQPSHPRRSSKSSSTTNISSLSTTRQSTTSSASPSTPDSTPTHSTGPSSTTTAPSSSDLIRSSTFEVLNELVLDRGPSPYVSNLELYGDTHLLTIIQADGVIISTPTGSTAYSLSAGGPLTHPSIPGILLTPICPHTLSFRPMVLSDTLLLRLVVPRHSRGGAYASFDGKGRVELRRGDEVRVEAGRYPFPTVVGEEGTGGEWFESVRRALRWNTRGAIQGGFGSRVNGTEMEGLDEEGEAREGDEVEGGEEEGEQWDIAADPFEAVDRIESAGGGLGEVGRGGSESTSPLRRGGWELGLD